MRPGLRLFAATAIGLLLAGMAAWWVRSQDAASRFPPPKFVGSEACAGCHADEFARWQSSQHAHAMQKATEATVLGRFDNASFTAAGVTSRFFRRDGRFFVNTDGPGGKLADFEVKYTFGLYPLQQYLVPLPGGRLQALGVAWDTRPAADGGQRWFHLYPGQKLAAGHPLHWTGIDQNWNYQCADCHSTNLHKGYDERTAKYATTWSEISVGCEACHGPASNHIAWARKWSFLRRFEAGKGLTVALDERRGVTWTARKSGTAQRSSARLTSREINVCAPCHARRGQFADDLSAGQNWLNAYRPALLDAGLYYADGQQREEVYTWGSFLQSRMHAAGVTCADCHDPHTQKLRAPGNAVCTQCHAPTTFDTAEHHHHRAGTPGAACVACHMPTTTYMVVDPRHDHSLRIPRPDRSVTLGTPNACNTCHADQPAQWAAEAVARWYPERKPGFQGFAEAFAAADGNQPDAVAMLLSIVQSRDSPELVRASAAARSARYLSPQVTAGLDSALKDPSALLRASAAEALAGADAGWRAEHLAPLLGDPVRLVRMAAARSLAGPPEKRLVGNEPAQFAAALGEWIAAQQYNADRPEAIANLGSLQLERGALDDAVASFRRSLAMDPWFVPAAVNLADALRMRGDESGATAALRESLARQPQAAVLHHVLGLSLIRQGKMDEALNELAAAQRLSPETARFAFVYAVALHDTGRAADAIATLKEALRRHPHARDLQQTLAAYEAGNR